MKKAIKLSILATLIVLCLLIQLSCVGKNSTENGAVQMITKKGSQVVAEIKAPSLEGNLIGEYPGHKAYVYLPPSYDEGKKHYPTVYFLHGYGDSSSVLMNTLGDKLDAAFQKNRKEFIVVILDGNTRSGGSFYENSPVSGNWEDFIVRDVVDYIDGHFRTLAKASSRAITGYSMGGYGAFNIAIKHPDVFCSVSVFCPGVYADGCIKDMWKSWTGWYDVKTSYAQAFSPNLDTPPRYCNIPSFSGTDEDNKILEDWDKGYGCWTQKIDDYVARGSKLKGIQLNYSDDDGFFWIPTGTRFVSELLTERKIKHELHEFGGGHIVPADVVESYFVPFFKKHLSYK